MSKNPTKPMNDPCPNCGKEYVGPGHVCGLDDEEQAFNDSLVALDAIEEKEQALGFEKEKFLRKCGWENRCDIPDAMSWRWVKKVDGRLVAVSRESAISFERRS